MKLYIKDGIVMPGNRIVCHKEIEGEKYNVYAPHEEDILAEGWVEYTPPTPEPIEPTHDERYKSRIVELIRERYTQDDEIALLRQRDGKPEEFAEYNAFVEQCKAQARTEVYGEDGV